MYMDNNWSPVGGQELADLLKYIGPIDGRIDVSPSTTNVARRKLDFYDRVEMIRVKDPAWQPRNLFVYYLADAGKLFRLNGTSPPIHEVNAKAPVRITEDNCIDYLEFFCFFVRGEEGPFLIAQSMEDTYVPKQIDDKTRMVLEGTIRPALVNDIDAEGNIFVDAVVYYSNALFTAEFRIEPTGMVEMRDDQPIAADLPVKIDAPLS